MEKGSIALVLVVALLASLAWGLSKSLSLDEVRIELKRQEAVMATGPCGTQFSADVHLGNRTEHYVGGQPVDDVSSYFQKEEGETTLVYRKEDGRDVVVMRRRR